MISLLVAVELVIGAVNREICVVSGVNRQICIWSASTKRRNEIIRPVSKTEGGASMDGYGKIHAIYVVYLSAL